MTIATTPLVPPASRRRERVRLWGAVGATVILWASAFVGIRGAAEDFDPGALTLGRIAVGAVALAVLHCVMRMRRGEDRVSASQHARFRDMPRKVLIGVVVWGVAWFGAYNLALNAAERHIDAGTAALLVNLAPMIIAVLAGVFLGEGFPRRLIAGMVVALLGVIVVAVATSTGRVDGIGVALGVAAAVIYAAATTLQKRLLRDVRASTMTLVGCLAGTVACLPFAPQLVSELQAAPASAIVAIIYLGVFPTAVAFTTWGYVLTRMSAGRTAATTYAVPAVVVVLSWIVLHETPPILALAGGAMALVGVALATARKGRALLPMREAGMLAAAGPAVRAPDEPRRFPQGDSASRF